MSLSPRPFKCPKCLTVIAWNGQAESPLIDDAPACPKCWSDFVRANVPVMTYAPGESMPPMPAFVTLD